MSNQPLSPATAGALPGAGAPMRRRGLRGRLAAALGVATTAALLTVGSLLGHHGATTTVQAAALTLTRSTSTTSTTSGAIGAGTAASPAALAPATRIASPSFVPGSATTGALWSAWAPSRTDVIVSAASDQSDGDLSDGDSFAI